MPVSGIYQPTPIKMTFADTTEKVIVQPDILNETAAIVPKAHETFDVAQGRFSQDYQLLHSLEGRWRVKIERLGYDPDYASNLVAILEDSNVIAQVRCNEAAESLIIEYNYEEISPEQLREYILLSMEEADRGYLLTTKAGTAPPSHEINYWERLGIPAASLALALVAFPLELPPLLVGGLILAAARLRASLGRHQRRKTIDCRFPRFPRHHPQRRPGPFHSPRLHDQFDRIWGSNSRCHRSL